MDDISVSFLVYQFIDCGRVIVVLKKWKDKKKSRKSKQVKREYFIKVWGHLIEETIT